MSKGNKMTTTIKAYGIKHTVTTRDSITWREALDNYVNLLNTTGYIISLAALENWVEEKEDI